MKLLLSPHSDDEALFASYLALEHHPLVIVCLQGRRARHLPANATREAETAAAMRLLGCDYAFLPVTCDPPDWPTVEKLVRDYGEPSRVFAPFPEHGGHFQHNAIGNMAASLWPDKVTFFTTYTLDGHRTTIGERVAERPGWDTLKRRALSCYASQLSKPDTAFHFHRDPAEYVVEMRNWQWAEAPLLKLNLGAGHNPIDGFTNLDKQDGWLFEDGLGTYHDGSVDAITVSHALMYVPLHHWPAVFAEMARVLKPGGILRVTEDAIGAEGSARQEIRPHAAVATTADLVLGHMADAGLGAEQVTPNISLFGDLSLVQQNYGEPPTVFHAEGVKPL